ncbi:MAG TPA: exodeoxyribonuclease I [Patescibacteria group bacterium]|jgi:exodeoxyribonuclease-1|nr:exodeoxyribonuclease I [Patescibacteria group bacterium]
MQHFTPTFFFYDLETSGFDPKSQRIMQFAGQRTNLDLTPVGEPVNLLVSLTDEVLPDPSAIMVTGITPQKTRAEGYLEPEFLKQLYDQVLTPGTTILGFNSVRFDDEFMRYTLYRNFYDPYEWQWQDGRSRWDMLDVVRMTRALRPTGIEWPVDADGQSTNRLELLAKANSLQHTSAHDALSDVQVLIDLARLIKTKQPKLFDYLYSNRAKSNVAKLANLDDPQPFVYTSGRYSKDILHTTVAVPIAPGGRPGSVVVYDLRHDPDLWANKSTKELLAIRQTPYEERKSPSFVPLPVKELAFNKCPAVAPLGVLDADAQSRLALNLEDIKKNLAKLSKSNLGQKLQELFAMPNDYAKTTDVDGQLYDGFVAEGDKTKMRIVRAADELGLSSINPEFTDKRLKELLLRYKARNYPKSLSSADQSQWDMYRNERLKSSLPGYVRELAKQAAVQGTDKQFALEELRLWAESIMPADA